MEYFTLFRNDTFEIWCVFYTYITSHFGPVTPQVLSDPVWLMTALNSTGLTIFSSEKEIKAYSSFVPSDDSSPDKTSCYILLTTGQKSQNQKYNRTR